MNREALKNILQNAYDRDQWISTLQFLTGKRDLLTVNLSPREIEIHTQEADRIIKTFYQIGTVKTSDGVSLPIFEIVLEDAIRIEQNRVGVNEFIKKYIIKDAVKGALTTFSYDHNHEKSEWRFSFISKNSANDFFAEAEAIETNPKKFTYIFGNKEAHRTAIERLYNLEQSRFRLEDFFEAFNVEPVSKKFFDDYKKHYEEISEFLIESKYFPLFEKKDDENHKPEKEVRNFVSRLMGRIVFLYFLQKKHWLGASNTDYTDGNPNFLSDLFFNDTKNQNDFYQKYLCPIFFNALNTPDRKNDEFQLENGEKVSIPFLNGGLFEEEQEPNDHRTIKFPKYLFEELFKFFNGYNFTIYENSPEEHTVAVDPEMLGHIFENLIDYNKDTGTFYTPKEIVQYMTQESLIEYLNTHLEKGRSEIENLIKNQSANHFEDKELSKINKLLDDVKICDPAIGSGAFPMGMLQEIFNLKALINYRLGFEVWSPASVKQNIIQNSIYGVDLDEGAVEIARLRFWLSLVVDEGMPKALPNLDYKIMQGNSLLESYKGIDLSGISSGNDLKIVEEMQTDLWGNLVDDQMKITVGKSGLADEIQKLIRKYFTAKAADKKNIKTKIENKISEHIEFNIELRENQLSRQIAELEIVTNPKANQKKALEKYRADLENLVTTKAELKKEQKKEEKNYFLWHLFFADVLGKDGFDIVIGNPPYIKEYTNKSAFDGFRISPYYIGKMDIWYGFASKGFDILKENGVECFIAQNNWITSAGAKLLREDVLKRTEIKQFIDFGDYKVFQSAGIQTMIYVIQKKVPSNNYDLKYSVLEESKISKNELTSFLDFRIKNNFSNKYIFNLSPEKYRDKTISFNDSLVNKLLQKIENKGTFKLTDDEVANGIHPHYDFVNKKIKEKHSDLEIGQGIFGLSEKEKNEMNLLEEELKLIKPYYTSEQIEKYFANPNNKLWIIYTDSSFKNPKNIEPYPNIKKHLDQFQDVITSDNKPYGLHRARKEDFFVGEKIISLRKSANEPQFTYADFDCYVSATFYVIKTKRISQKYLTAYLNSKVVTFWLKNKGKMQGSNYQLDKEPLVNIPIVLSEYENEIIQLFDGIKNQQENKNLINQIDTFLYKTFNFTENEINLLENHLTK
ncbi:Eco57I restriction-modification methylase domain-containing protein [Weeksellaceae bacterium A-14]